MRVQKGLIGLIVILQAVLFLTHFLVYETWTFSPAGSDIPGMLWIKLVLGFLSVSFVAASLLAFRYTNAAVRAFYRIAAVWLGFLTFLFFAAVFSWMIFGVARLAALDEAAMAAHWKMTWGDQTIVDMPRAQVLRKWVMNHLVHHRAQLGVYLRLNGIPIPGVYGPSADEMPS